MGLSPGMQSAVEIIIACYIRISDCWCEFVLWFKSLVSDENDSSKAVSPLVLRFVDFVWCMKCIILFFNPAILSLIFAVFSVWLFLLYLFRVIRCIQGCYYALNFWCILFQTICFFFIFNTVHFAFVYLGRWQIIHFLIVIESVITKSLPILNRTEIQYNIQIVCFCPKDKISELDFKKHTLWNNFNDGLFGFISFTLCFAANGWLHQVKEKMDTMGRNKRNFWQNNWLNRVSFIDTVFGKMPWNSWLCNS